MVSDCFFQEVHAASQGHTLEIHIGVVPVSTCVCKSASSRPIEKFRLQNVLVPISYVS